MAFRFFETEDRASIYQKHMLHAPKEVYDVILSYLEEKKERPFELLVDVGCGSGQSTNVLAAYFQKVVGIDISEVQIQEAKRIGSPPNVSYLVAAAEKMPFEDSSVDLITASVAGHWFKTKDFMIEVERLLKPNGCLAYYCIHGHLELYYKDCSQSASDAFNESYKDFAKAHHVCWIIDEADGVNLHVSKLPFEGSRCCKRVSAKTARKVFEALPAQTEGPGHRLQPGDWVVTRNFGRKRNLEPRFVGPFQVLLATRTAVRLEGRKNWVHATHTKRVPIPLPADSWVRTGIAATETETPACFIPFSDAQLVENNSLQPDTSVEPSALENSRLELSSNRLDAVPQSEQLFEEQTQSGRSRYFLCSRNKD